MLAKLRRRFTLILTSLIALILLVILAIMLFTTYQSEQHNINNSLRKAVELGPSGQGIPWIGGHSSELLYPRNDGSAADNPRGRDDTDGSRFTPVYVVSVNLAGFNVIIDNSSLVYMDSTLVDTALKRIIADWEAATDGVVSPYTNGTADGSFSDLHLRWQYSYSADGVLTIALADESPVVNAVFNQAVISAIIWLVAVLVFFFISLLLARFATKPVAQAWEQQRRFVADASHELKTPLTVILANNSIIRSDPGKTIAEQEQWIQSTQEEAQRMDGLVRDLLLLAQTDEDLELDGKRGVGAATANKESVDLSALVERGLLQFEAVLFERGISLEQHIEADVKVQGDEEQLMRLVQILLDNASKYATQTTQAPPSINVALSRDAASASKAKLVLNNSSEPIAPELLPHLFERFYRINSAHSDAEGYGLGLSLAQGIVLEHGGSIGVSSTAKEGTTFTVVL